MDAVIIPANWRDVRRPRPSISMCRGDFTLISAPPQCNHAPEHKCRRTCSFFRVATDPSWHLVKVEEPGAGESPQPAPVDQPATRSRERAPSLPGHGKSGPCAACEPPVRAVSLEDGERRFDFLAARRVTPVMVA
jgi:hypothetical protein